MPSPTPSPTPIVVTVTKPETSSPVGIGMKDVRGIGLVISSIRGDGLCSGTPLEVGMKLISINRQPCTNMSLVQAITLMQTSKETVVIEATPGIGELASASSLGSSTRSNKDKAEDLEARAQDILSSETELERAERIARKEKRHRAETTDVACYVCMECCTDCTPNCSVM